MRTSANEYSAYRINDKPIFFEFWVVEVEGNRPVLKLKHFNAGFVGWEDKNSDTKIPLVSNAENDVVFAEADSSVSLDYHRTGANLTCVVHHVQNVMGSDETNHEGYIRRF